MLNLQRYPETKNSSLKLSSAADDYILEYISDTEIDKNNIVIANDRFGYLSCHLYKWNPSIIINYSSQEKSILTNCKNNNLSINSLRLLSPLENLATKVSLALIRVPKSMELFRLFLTQIHKQSDENTLVIASFMTKYFSAQMLSIASEYFQEAEQSKAWKKSRLLLLKHPKEVDYKLNINPIKTDYPFNLQQYPGVFSSNKIDIATQFLMDNINLKQTENKILDLASGNGIIALKILKQLEENNWPEVEMHLLDNSILAIESSKLNLKEYKAYYHYNDSLEDFELNYFDLIVSNPPFHFEYEINTEISLHLFKESFEHLKKGGRFIVVYNRHLNYSPFLKKYFSSVKISKENHRFVLLECIKS